MAGMALLGQRQKSSRKMWLPVTTHMGRASLEPPAPPDSSEVHGTRAPLSGHLERGVGGSPAPAPASLGRFLAPPAGNKETPGKKEKEKKEQTSAGSVPKKRRDGEKYKSKFKKQ